MIDDNIREFPLTIDDKICYLRLKELIQNNFPKYKVEYMQTALNFPLCIETNTFNRVWFHLSSFSTNHLGLQCRHYIEYDDAVKCSQSGVKIEPVICTVSYDNLKRNVLDLVKKYLGENND
jgi:hypothetical protein